MADEREFLGLLRQIAPGTPFRQALDSINRLGKGALILIADKEQAADVLESGFELNTDFTPQKLTELSKMDRAIVVDKTLKKILYANVLLVPKTEISSRETGTRHLAAEKVAKQIHAPTLAVSASKDRVTVYYGETSYILPDFSTLTARVNQALHILEQYRSTLDNRLDELTSLEFEGRVMPDDVAGVIQLMVQMVHVEADTGRWFVELGEEKYLHQQLLEWLMLDVTVRLRLVVCDYKKVKVQGEKLVDAIVTMPRERLLEHEEVLAVLGYDDLNNDENMTLVPRGYRVLHEIHRLPSAIASRVVKKFSTLTRIAESSEDDLMKIKGIAGVRARAIRAGMVRMRAMCHPLS